MEGNSSRIPTHLWGSALVVGIASTVGFFALPRGSLTQAVFGGVVASVFAGAIVVGVHLHRAADRATWWLFAAGTLLWIVGDVAAAVNLAQHREFAFPSLADAASLAAYPFFFAAVARLDRSPADAHVRERRLDSFAVAIGALVLTWQPLLHDYATDPTLSFAGRSILIAYLVLDVALLYAVMRTVVFSGRKGPVDVLIAASLFVTIVGDLGHGFLGLAFGFDAGGLVDATWLLGPVLLGAAALHPSTAAAESGPRAQPPRLSWLLTVGLTSLTPAASLLAGIVLHKNVNVVGFAALSLFMAMLAIVRMSWMFDGLRERAKQLEVALTERDVLQHDLRHRAVHDPLTGSVNRAVLSERIEQAMADARRADDLIALVVCDIDGFKTVNDSLGHQAGDDLLVTAAARIASVVRPGDTIARLGGDEFAALLDGVADRAFAAAVADRIVAALREPVDLGGEVVTVTASAGVAVPETARSAEELLGDADAAMHEAKAQGKNRHLLFEPWMRARAMERLQFTTSFVGAVERSEFRLEFQPSFSLSDGRLQSFEALVRWDHPRLGLVPPGRFIPLAEETGFISTLGRWVLDAACRQAMDWPTGADGAPTIAVNVSARQLTDPAFAADVRGVLAGTGLPGPRLVLEVTESALITDEMRSVDVLRELGGLGVRVAIDDFGVGYSSLSQLHRLPVHTVKIDKSFVDLIGDERNEGRPLIEAIVSLAKHLDLTTVAEGIEMSAQRDVLADIGCDNGQGFLLSRPLDASSASALTRRPYPVAFAR